MDLVVNGPLKAAIRRARCEGLFDYFQVWCKVWHRELAKTNQDERNLPLFAPPKPTLAEGLATLMNAVNETFEAKEFRAGLRRTYVKVGLAKDSVGRYTRYTGQGHCSLEQVLGLAG